MTKHILYILIFYGQGQSIVHAQELPLFAQYADYHGLINSASVPCTFLTSGRTLSIGAGYRSQWAQLGRDIAPLNQVLRIDQLSYKHKTVVGGYLQKDQLGITNQSTLQVRYAKIIPLGKDLLEGGFSIGINLGGYHRQLKTDDLFITDLDDPNIALNPSVKQLDVGAGLYLYKKWRSVGDYIYGGFSMPRIQTRNNDLTTHYYGLLGMYIALKNKRFLELSTWTRHVKNLPWQTSFNARYQPQHWTWIGAGMIVSAKTPPAFISELGFNFRINKNTLKIGYAFSLSQSRIRAHFGNSHEFNMAYLLDTRRER